MKRNKPMSITILISALLCCILSSCKEKTVIKEMKANEKTTEESFTETFIETNDYKDGQYYTNQEHLPEAIQLAKEIKEQYFTNNKALVDSIKYVFVTRTRLRLNSTTMTET